MYWAPFRHVLGIIQTCIGHHSDMFWASFRHVLGINQTCFGHHSGPSLDRHLNTPSSVGIHLSLWKRLRRRPPLSTPPLFFCFLFPNLDEVANKYIWGPRGCDCLRKIRRCLFWGRLLTAGKFSNSIFVGPFCGRSWEVIMTLPKGLPEGATNQTNAFLLPACKTLQDTCKRPPRGRQDPLNYIIHANLVSPSCFE